MAEFTIGTPVAEVPGKPVCSRKNWQPVADMCRANPGWWVPIECDTKVLTNTTRTTVAAIIKRGRGAFSGPGHWESFMRGLAVYIRWTEKEK